MCYRMERHQSWIYLTCILAGLAIGLTKPDATAPLEATLWPLLGGLLYATFSQIPLSRIGQGMKDWRFIAALLFGNFVAIPLVFGGLMAILPVPLAVKAGVLLVLLVPCTDWFISFTHLGEGDAGRAIAATPLLLLVQMLMLPVYLYLFLGTEWLQAAISTHLLGAFTGLIVIPLSLAWLTQRLAERHFSARRMVNSLSLFPVPMLALVVFSVIIRRLASPASIADHFSLRAYSFNVSMN